MRPLAFVLIVLASGLAQAQQPLAPAAPQADDAEVPGAPPPPVPVAPPQAPPIAAPPVLVAPGHGPLLLAPVAPAGYQYRLVDGPPRQERRWGLFTAGLVTFGGVWMANLQAGIPTGEYFLDIPLIGPLLEISQFTNRSYDDYYSSGSRSTDGWMIFLLVTDAAAQIGGFAMMIAGATTTRTKRGAQSIQLVPLGTGAAIRGTF